MSTISHFNIPAYDIERAKKFYNEVFDWKITRDPGPIEYYMIETTTENGEVGLGGGMAKKEGPDETITPFIDVPSIDECLKKIEGLGGKVISPKMAIPNTGYVAVCTDSESNAIGLWETDENAR
ncbi:MAG: VOC family protein [Halobacteriota archaeon]|nr:VOC family protein [Halobacteriota archaeon]